MSIASDNPWFESQNALLQELRQRGGTPSSPPEIPGYGDLRELKRGGQGVVFTGTQLSTRRRVAIKILLDGALASPESKHRFAREIEAISGLQHPHIVRVYDSGVSPDGRLYYIMEYIDGVGLDEWLSARRAAPSLGSANRKLSAESERAALRLFSKICSAVQHAHQRGIIHRDIKPSNVRINAEGEPQVLDFGLAKLAESADHSQMSQVGRFMGSLPWASPEQAEGVPERIDVRSDVYSLGVVLYQFLTNEFPYPVTGPLREILEGIQHRLPRSPRDVRPDLSDELSAIVLKCLAKDPDQRYQSAGEIARDLQRYQSGEPIEAKRQIAWYSLRVRLNRYKTAARVTAALLILSVAFGASMALLWRRTSAAERLAEMRLGDVRKAHSAEVAARKAVDAQVEKTRKVAGFLDATMRAVDPWKHPGRDLGPMREMLDAAVARLNGAFTDQPEVEATIAGTLGWDYWQLGLLEPAEALLRTSFNLFRQTAGEDDIEFLAAENNLALLLMDRAKYAEASRHFERLVSSHCRVSGPDHPATLRAISNMALNLDWLGQSTQAEALYRETLAAQTRTSGPYDLDRLSTLNNLAACLPQLGKLAEAEQLYHELIECRTAAQGPDHPETLRARMNYAQFVSQSGRVVEAEALKRVVLSEMESTLGVVHPLTICALHNLAATVSNLGRHEEALALSRRALAAQVAFSGSDDPTTLTRKNEFVATLMELRRWDEAIPLARELREQFSRIVGVDDMRTLVAANNLAFALNQTGAKPEAETIWRQIVDRAGPTAGPTADPIITAKTNLGGLYADARRWNEAEREYRSAIAAQIELGQADHWRTAWMRGGLGRVLTELNRLDEADELLRAALKRLQELLGKDHEKTRRVEEYKQLLKNKRRAS